MTPPRSRDVLPAAVLRLASDERLIDHVRGGSERAFEAIFDRHHRPVLTFCRRMLGSQADAEDAVQHTFSNAYFDLKRSERPVALRPWLYAIARHRCLSVLRSRRERPVDAVPEPVGDHLDAVVGRREDVRATLADVAQLPNDQRAALVLAELGDVSHDEIARLLGCRREKVKALVFQARTALAHDRAARDTSCAAIREQLGDAGGGMRQAVVRRHLRECPGCRAFHRSARARRGQLGLLLPAIALKRLLFGALPGLGGGGAVATGALSGGGLAATALAAVAIAGTDPGASASATAVPDARVARAPAVSETGRRAVAPALVVRARNLREAPAVAIAVGGAPVAGAGRHAAPPAAAVPQVRPAPERRAAEHADRPADAPAEPAIAAAAPASGGEPAPPASRRQGERPEPAPRGGKGKPGESPAPGAARPAEPPGLAGTPPGNSTATPPAPGPPAELPGGPPVHAPPDARSGGGPVVEPVPPPQAAAAATG